MPLLKTIIRRRKVLDLTQAKLAKLAGVSQSLIAKVESGKIDPSYSKVMKILETLDRIEKEEQVKAKDIMTKDVFWAKNDDRPPVWSVWKCEITTNSTSPAETCSLSMFPSKMLPFVPVSKRMHFSVPVIIHANPQSVVHPSVRV